MRRRGEISLADIMVAFQHLRPVDAESRELLMRMMVPQGVLASTSAGGRLDRREEVPASRPGPVPSFLLGGEAPPETPMSPRVREPPPAGGFIPAVLQRSRRDVPEVPVLGSEVEVLEGPSASLPVMPMASPLFVPAWHAGILTAALATPQPEGPLDIPKVVPLLARRLPVKVFPRRQVHSLRLGVRVLVDVSESMLPFAQDREQLLNRVRTLVGPDRTEVHRFTGAPSRRIRTHSRAALLPFEPPLHGMPLLVLSDLGIGAGALEEERADATEWLRFEDMARGAGCRVVVLVPYSPVRWPRALRRRMVLIHWDRYTTARTILQALRR